MKPSISMLAWYMRDDKPVCSIKTDAPTISGVRFLADETVKLSPDYVYVGAASAFFSDEKYAEGYIVVHGQDFLLFTGKEFSFRRWTFSRAGKTGCVQPQQSTRR